jgi:hypothetical protein
MKQSVLCSALACLLGACAGQQMQPTMASSVDSVAYAQRYPETLESTRTLLAEEKTQAQSLSAGLAAQTKELKTPVDTDLLLEIVDAADDAGKSEAMAQAHAQDRAVRAFWEEERGTIGSRVSNSVQQKATEAKCEGNELTSSVPYALREGVDKQLERRLRSQNGAHVIVERNRVALGQANLPVVQKLVDDVTMSSYLVHIALIEDSNRISSMLREQRGVQRTLDDAIEAETNPANAAATASERKASAERLAALTKARDSMAQVVTNAEGEVKTSQDQVKAAQAEYDAALSELRDELRKLSLAR